jgi:hypothetical protein
MLSRRDLNPLCLLFHHGAMKIGALGGTCTLKNPVKGRGLCYYSFERL